MALSPCFPLSRSRGGDGSGQRKVLGLGQDKGKSAGDEFSRGREGEGRGNKFSEIKDERIYALSGSLPGRGGPYRDSYIRIIPQNPISVIPGLTRNPVSFFFLDSGFRRNDDGESAENLVLNEINKG